MATQPENIDDLSRIPTMNSAETIFDELWELADKSVFESLRSPAPLLLPEPISNVQEENPISLLEAANALSKSGLESEARGFRMKAMLLMQVMT
tara:strand:- start:287 stop:568 length:282 start_codon:yes stop_codon:yes gene_type:complete